VEKLTETRHIRPFASRVVHEEVSPVGNAVISEIMLDHFHGVRFRVCTVLFKKIIELPFFSSGIDITNIIHIVITDQSLISAEQCLINLNSAVFKQ
jgi:hypothetical protein